MSATYTKLRDGSWGIRGPAAEIQSYKNVTVTKKDGTSKTEMVVSVVWSGNGVSIATIAKLENKGGYGASRRRRQDEDHEDCLSIGWCGSHGCYMAPRNR